MAENCGNCIHWQGGEGGPADMQDMGVCQIITAGDPQAMVVDGEFLCASAFYCSLYEGDGDGESMGEGGESGATDTWESLAASAGAGGGYGL